MSGIEGELYRLFPRDVKLTWLESTLRRVNLSQAAGIVIPQFTVPEDRVLLLRSALAHADGGGAQTVNTVQIIIFPNDDINLQIVLAMNITTGAPGEAMVAWSGEVFVPPGASVAGLGGFSAAVAANLVNFSAAGLLIPRGNIAV